MEVLYATNESKALIKNVAIDGARLVTMRNEVVAPRKPMIEFYDDIIAEFFMIAGERETFVSVRQTKVVAVFQTRDHPVDRMAYERKFIVAVPNVGINLPRLARE